MDEKIDAETLSRDAGKVRIIDIRKKPDDRQIPGSERYDAEALSSAEFVPFHFNDNIVLYCGSGNSCSVLAEELRERGYNARALEGGYAAWKSADLPTEPISEQLQF